MSDERPSQTADDWWTDAKNAEGIRNRERSEAARLAQVRLRHLEAAVARHARAEEEIAKLRALVTRLTDVADALASELSDPGSEALAAIHCGRHFIYG